MDYNALLEQVRLGELDKFVIEHTDFQEFYEIWRRYPYQNTIRGIAAQGGKVTYVKADEQI
ncbi:MAG: hypothetical protein LBT37_07125 [Lactobacillaceae bacterium]|nr:hypothetical protein [Lactobacillaceae bacterium]